MHSWRRSLSEEKEKEDEEEEMEGEEGEGEEKAGTVERTDWRKSSLD